MAVDFDQGLAVARAARDAGAVAEALGRYAELRSRFPRRREPYAEAADMLRAAGEEDEADILLEVMATRVPPTTPDLFAPPDLTASLEEATRLREQGQFDLAETMLREAALHHPGDARPLIDLAWLALHRRDPASAATLWQNVRERFPAQLMGYTGAAVALRVLRRFDEAAALLDQAAQLFPDDPGPDIERAYLAIDQGFKQPALDCLTRLRAALGEHPLVMQGLAYAAALPDPAPVVPEGALPALPFPGPAGIDPRQRALVAGFESLGGDSNGHALGLVQRACGAEPLSLLRWADVSAERLAALLESRFVGFDSIDLFLRPNAAGEPEYGVRDTRGGLTMRSFLTEAEVPADVALTAIRLRLDYLARRQVEALRSADRIFVYCINGVWPEEDVLNRLRLALRAYGAARLLLVRPATADRPAGSVFSDVDGLMIGALAPAADTAAWLTLLATAAAS
jgi:Flp pilus assembly protein TadD